MRVETAVPEGEEDEVRVGREVLVEVGLAVEVRDTMEVAVRVGCKGEDVLDTMGD